MHRRLAASLAALALAFGGAPGEPRAAAAPAVVPFELIGGHIFVDARVDGKGPYRFAVDTGASDVLASDVAGQIGLHTGHVYTLFGTGERAVEARDARVAALALDGATLANQDVTVLDFAELRAAEGVEHFDGLIGHELFDRYIVRIDYRAQTLTLLDRDAVVAPAPGDVVVPLHFFGTMPEVDGDVDGVAGSFTVDTGDRGSLSLLAHFVAANTLAARYRPRSEGVAGWGIGGAVRARLARVGTLHFGGLAVVRPVTRFPESEHGFFAGGSVAGNIGAGILRRFAVTFDYAHARMLVHPTDAAAEPDPYDRSGMWILAAPEGFRVADVNADGPAAKAGVRAGDLIDAVDGRAADAIGLIAERAALRSAAPGTTVALRLRRGGATLEVTLVLADLV